MSTIKLPDQLYITYRRENKNQQCVRLGFISPFGKDQAFEKRKRTQNTWAYSNVKFDSNGKGTVETWVYEKHPTTGQHERVCSYAPLDNDLYPEVLENKLLPGFEVSKNVRRTWSSNNVLWRITDPRGFELEISSENMANILDCCTLVNGVIQEKCIWARNGASNILLPETSEPYVEAIKNTKRFKKSVPLKSIKVGSLVDVITPKLGENELLYLGKQYIGYFESKVTSVRLNQGDRWGHTRTDAFLPSFKDVDHRYCFVSPTTNTMYSTSSPKISSVLREPEVGFDPSFWLKDKIKDGNRWGVISVISKEKLTKVQKVDFVPYNDKEKEDFKKKTIPLFGIIVKYQDEFWSIQAIPTSNEPQYTLLKVILGDREVNTETRFAEVNNLFGGKKSLYAIKFINDLTEVEPYWLEIEHNAGKYLTRLPTLYGVTYD